MSVLQQEKSQENFNGNMAMQGMWVKVHRKCIHDVKMVTHKCFQCEKIVKQDYTKKKIRCPYCGSKILYKPRVVNTKVKTDYDKEEN